MMKFGGLLKNCLFKFILFRCLLLKINLSCDVGEQNKNKNKKDNNSDILHFLNILFKI